MLAIILGYTQNLQSKFSEDDPVQQDRKALIDRIKQKLPYIKVLYMSGYTDNVIVHHGIIDEKVNFIQKPFLINDIAQKLNEIFEEK
jgi:DNA-binding NtrC family response regulator